MDKRLINLLIIFLISFISSCGEENTYDRSDLLFKYFESKNLVFQKYNDFHLLVIRDIKLRCVDAHLHYSADALIASVRDSVTSGPIVILSDNDYINITGGLLYHDQRLHFVREKTETLIQFGFYIEPILFHIKQQKILSWKRMGNE